MSIDAKPLPEDLRQDSTLFGEANKPIDGGLIDGLMEAIEEEYSPKTDTFNVTIILGGDPVLLPFKRLLDGEDMEELQRRAVAWAQSLLPRKLLKGAKKVSPMSPDMKEWFVPKVDVLAKVYIITQLAILEEFKTEWKVMKLYRKAWPIFNSIIAQIDLAATNQIGEGEKAQYDAEKKD